MSRARRTQAAAFTLIAAVIFAAFPARDALLGSPASADGPAGGASTPTLRRVQVRTPEERTIRRVVRLPADIIAWQDATIGAKVSGYVKSVAVDVGSRVMANDELVVLDVPELDAAVELARGGVLRSSAAVAESKAARDSARTGIAQAVAETAHAAADVSKAEAERERAAAELAYRVTIRDRQDAVAASSPQLVSQEAVDEARGRADVAKASVGVAAAMLAQARALVDVAKAREDSAKARLAAMEAGVASAEASEKAATALLSVAEAQTSFARIRAPFAGIVTNRWVDPGDLVRSAVGSDNATSVVRVVDTSKVRVRFRASESDAPPLKRGNTFRLVIDELSGRELKGTVARVAEALELETRTMMAEGDLDNADGALRHGMFGRIWVDLETHEGALVVPAEAVTTSKRKSSVLVVEDGKVSKRSIRIGADDGIWVEVLDGLKGRDSVITVGRDLVSEGERVEAVAEPTK